MFLSPSPPGSQTKFHQSPAFSSQTSLVHWWGSLVWMPLHRFCPSLTGPDTAILSSDHLLAFLLIASATASKPRISTPATGPPTLRPPSTRPRPPGRPNKKARPSDRRPLDFFLAQPHVNIAFDHSSVPHSASLSSCLCRCERARDALHHSYRHTPHPYS